MAVVDVFVIELAPRLRGEEETLASAWIFTDPLAVRIDEVALHVEDEFLALEFFHRGRRVKRRFR